MFSSPSFTLSWHNYSCGLKWCVFFFRLFHFAMYLLISCSSQDLKWWLLCAKKSEEARDGGVAVVYQITGSKWRRIFKFEYQRLYWCDITALAKAYFQGESSREPWRFTKSKDQMNSVIPRNSLGLIFYLGAFVFMFYVISQSLSQYHLWNGYHPTRMSLREMYLEHSNWEEGRRVTWHVFSLNFGHRVAFTQTMTYR